VKEYHFNLVAPLTIAAAIWLGLSERVDWWVIALIGLSMAEVKFTWRAR
jgi:hypothetical protein